MAENTVSLQEYVESYVPGLVSKRLQEKPIPDMEGTDFSVQLVLKGEKSLAYGISIKDAKEITVHAGGMENPMLEVTIPEDVIRPLVDMVSSFTGRKQYDAVTGAKGTVTFEIGMPGNWTLPVTIKFNGADSPSVTISASSQDFAKMATGELSGPMAFMQGKVKLDGDMSFALSLANLMP